MVHLITNSESAHPISPENELVESNSTRSYWCFGIFCLLYIIKTTINVLR